MCRPAPPRPSPRHSPPPPARSSAGRPGWTVVTVSTTYGRSRQCGRPVGARCSMGLGRNPLIHGLIQHAFKINFLFVEKIQVIPFD